jgi:hypothetical protein
MQDKSFEEKVLSIDWAKYLEPEYYDPERMDYFPDKTVGALIKLNQYNELEGDFNSGLGSEVRYAIGNDHRGTYYPAALEAIDLIVEIEKHSELVAARKCDATILNDLYYFRLELGSDDTQLYEAIESIIREKLEPYSDENMTNYWQ